MHRQPAGGVRLESTYVGLRNHAISSSILYLPLLCSGNALNVVGVPISIDLHECRRTEPMSKDPHRLELVSIWCRYGVEVSTNTVKSLPKLPRVRPKIGQIRTKLPSCKLEPHSAESTQNKPKPP